MQKDLPQPRGRVEDARLTTGAGIFVDDLQLENQAYLGIVRSPYAHAKIKKIDFSKARQSPNFIASLTGEELVKLGVAPLVQFPMQKPANRYQLAVEKTVYVGEAVAAILAKARYAAEDLVDDVDVEYEELPAIATLEEAKKNSFLIFESWKDNIALKSEAKRGDADAYLTSSKHVIRARFGIGRQAGTPMEPRAVAVRYDRDRDLYEVHGAVQSANRLQANLSQELKLPKEKFHVIVKDVGGGFGVKGAQSYPEHVLACVFSRATGLPVKWSSSRTEDLLETAPGRDEYCDMELACDAEGKLTALRATIETDAGVSGTLSIMGALTLRLLPGAYKIPNIDLKAVVYVTNKSASGPVRGAGRPEACFFIERAMDLLSREMNIDPLELRRRNILRPEEFPYDNGAGFIYDSANYPLVLDTLEKDGGYSSSLVWKQKFNADARSKNSSLIAGVGICTEIEDTGSQFAETARLVLNFQGDLVLFTGSSPHGQGLETSLAQLVSDELDVQMEKVQVIYGDTDLIPSGVGTFGSRSIAAGGSAAVDASRKLKVQLLENASKATGLESAKLVYRGGMVWSRGDQPPISIREIFTKLGLEESSVSTEYRMSQSTFASGAHLCELLLDRETGKLIIHRYVAVDDAGRIINRAIVDGQIHGGIIHGIGGAIYEEMLFDADAKPLSTSFMDYLIPSAVESPDIEIHHVETPSTITLDGSRGVGESGTIAAYPAILNALEDALSEAGKRGLRFAPATPERVYSALN
jgi:aerobic carbon-monoxide dehydrogenase large subunit